MLLDPSESDLQGTWVLVEGRLLDDEVTRRIYQPVRDHLKKVATDQSGWNVLYQDPVDGRYWELTYSTGDTQGGGPPRLSALTHEQPSGNTRSAESAGSPRASVLRAPGS